MSGVSLIMPQSMEVEQLGKPATKRNSVAGILELGGTKMHCFDGHGLIAKVAFKDGKAHFRSRYVQTEVRPSSFYMS